METLTEGNTEGNRISAQLRGETIAYALQSGVCNIAANFFEPYINYQTQLHYSKQAHGTYMQNLAGEFAGDIIGSGALILGETLAPQQLHGSSRIIRSYLDPLYSAAAAIAFSGEKCEPGYEQKVAEWKTFQERNLVRSLLMSGAGIAGNVFTQKMVVSNPSPASLIFKGKLLSTALTTALGLTVRLAFPSHMKGIDQWMGKKIAPFMDDCKLDDPACLSHAEKVQASKTHTPPNVSL